MSLDLQRAAEQPVSSVEELIQHFRNAEHPRAQHRVGLEHEKLLFPIGAATPVSYDGDHGIRLLLESLGRGGMTPFRDGAAGPIIALTRGEQTISLEPGGQFELSGRPFFTAREAHQENLEHLAEVKAAAKAIGLRFVALGYRPFAALSEMPWMPKRRYGVMRRTLPTRGSMALDMMLMTATGQVSLDWESEEDCARKVCVAARLNPLLIALYANSPLAHGKPTGLLSYRSRVWQDVDPTRCGYLPSMIDGTFSYRAYVDWALDAPLLFLRRRGEYVTPPMSFRQLIKGGFEGKPATHADWIDHLSTLFPEVRVKKVIEIRGADCVSAAQTGALVALWRGLFYDRQALSEAEALLPKLSFEQHLELHHSARSYGLKARLREIELSRLAAEMVAIAKRGLQRLDPADAPLLDVLEEIARAGRSPAERVLAAWNKERDPARLLSQFEL